MLMSESVPGFASRDQDTFGLGIGTLVIPASDDEEGILDVLPVIVGAVVLTDEPGCTNNNQSLNKQGYIGPIVIDSLVDGIGVPILGRPGILGMGMLGMGILGKGRPGI